jgi:hypothetical protein
VIAIRYIWYYLLLSRSLSEKNDNENRDTSTKAPISKPSIILLLISTLWRQYAETAIIKHSTDQSREAMGTESNDASSVVLEYVQNVKPDPAVLHFPPKYSLCRRLNHSTIPRPGISTYEVVHISVSSDTVFPCVVEAYHNSYQRKERGGQSCRPLEFCDSLLRNSQ